MTEDKSDTLRENASDLQEGHASLSVGEILKRARVQHGLSTAQVQAALRIKLLYIEALEKSDFERLPGQAYVVGYIKSYAEYLGLDSGKLVQLLRKQSGPQVTKPAHIFPVASDEQKIPSKRIIAISTVLLILILLTWKVTSPGGLNPEEIPSVPKDLKQQMTAPQKPPEESQPTTAAVEEPKPKPHPVVLKATQDVWVEIRDGSGQPVFSRVLKEGEEYWVPPDQSGYTMTTGNAGGLQPVVEGQMLPHLGRAGEVKRKISLNPWDLKGEPAPAVLPGPAPAAGAEAIPAVTPDAVPVVAPVPNAQAPVSAPAQTGQPE